MIGKEVADLIVDKARVTKEIFFTIYYTLTIAPKHEIDKTEHVHPVETVKSVQFWS